MADQTAILNKACVLVGANTVVSINDESPQANALSNVYEISLQSILSECKWNFCTSRATLSVAPTNSVQFLYPSEQFIYYKPNNVIRIHDTYPAGSYFREESGLIISDTAGLGLLYTYYDDNPNDYPSYFLDAFIDKLCSDIAYLIINNAQVAEAFVKKYVGVSLPKAVASNSQTGTQQFYADGAWTLAKYFNKQWAA